MRRNWSIWALRSMPSLVRDIIVQHQNFPRYFFAAKATTTKPSGKKTQQSHRKKSGLCKYQQHPSGGVSVSKSSAIGISASLFLTGIQRGNQNTKQKCQYLSSIWLTGALLVCQAVRALRLFFFSLFLLLS